MKKSKILPLIFLWICLPPQIVLADGLSRELIEKSGLEVTVMQMPASMASGIQQIEQRGIKVDEKFRAAWDDAAQTVYRADRILAAVEDALQDLTIEERRGLIAYYDTPAGQRIRMLEEQAVSPEVQSAILAYAPKFMSDKANSERMKLYRQIDEATNASNLNTELGMKVAYATAIGMANEGTEGPKLDSAEVAKQIEAQRPQMLQEMQQFMLLVCAYAYRELTVEEIEAYLKFLQAPAAKKFVTITMQSISKELAAQAESFGAELAKNLKRKDI
ncbi:MAG: DUF2059 domain-containing protein [Rhodomicrobium sp.]|nr:DUF2059 domain-containing protein [Rhodomicrobium sp.]